jgi:hypothetical protein
MNIALQLDVIYLFIYLFVEAQIGYGWSYSWVNEATPHGNLLLDCFGGGEKIKPTNKLGDH